MLKKFIFGLIMILLGFLLLYFVVIELTENIKDNLPYTWMLVLTFIFVVLGIVFSAIAVGMSIENREVSQIN